MSTPLTYSVESAAERLGYVVTADWLRHHIAELPHVRAGSGRGRGGRIGFTEAHLAEILIRLEQRPADAPKVDPDDWGVVSRGRRSA